MISGVSKDGLPRRRLLVTAGLAVEPLPEAAAERDFRSDTPEVRDERLPDLGVGRQPAEMNAAHPALGDIPHEERPARKTAEREQRDEFLGRMIGEGAQHGGVGGLLAQRRPARLFGGGKVAVVSRTHENPEPLAGPASIREVYEIPAGVSTVALVRALKAPHDPVVALRVVRDRYRHPLPPSRLPGAHPDPLRPRHGPGCPTVVIP